MPKTIVFEIVKPVEDCERPDHYHVTIQPSDPVTTCEILQQNDPIIDRPEYWNVEAYGLGVRKHGDIYDRETGCRMALASALRKIDDKELRGEIWKLYLEMFPVESRKSQLEIALSEACKLIAKMFEAEPPMPIHRTWRFGCRPSKEAREMAKEMDY